MPDENLPFRIAFLAEYDGTDFVGFQRQNNGRSVQGVLEDALSTLYERPITVCGCSRTDSGVHAKRHVSHADVPFMIPADRIPYAMNAILPEDVSIHASARVPDSFHARFHSVGKKYIYRIWNAPFRSAADRRFVVHVPGRVDIARMREAAKRLEGEHDFSAFCSESGQHANPVRRMDRILVRSFEGSPLIEIEVRGKSFLYNMVRIIAGTLVYAGQGKLDPEEISAILCGKDRRTAGKTMPSRGLTLEKVYYEPDPFAEKHELSQ